MSSITLSAAVMSAIPYHLFFTFGDLLPPGGIIQETLSIAQVTNNSDYPKGARMRRFYRGLRDITVSNGDLKQGTDDKDLLQGEADPKDGSLRTGINFNYSIMTGSNAVADR